MLRSDPSRTSELRNIDHVTKTMSSPPPILLLGSNGQVGSVLLRDLRSFGTVVSYDRKSCDIDDFNLVRATIRDIRPRIIINAAAYTAVDAAEINRDYCHRINALAPGIMAEEARKLDSYLIHYSTDYVFDGEKVGAYLETDLPRPLSVYGCSKAAGDLAVLSATEKATIIRVGWIYSQTGSNFAKTILRLATERNELQVVGDQFGAPTSAQLISTITCQLVRLYLSNSYNDSGHEAPFGIYNLAPTGITSRHAYAVYLVQEASRRGLRLKASKKNVISIASENLPGAARRPKNSSLNTDKIQRLLMINLPEWREDIRTFIDRLVS